MSQVGQITGSVYDHCQLKFINFQAHENHISHETQGLSKKHLVVRRGKPFQLTLMFDSRWNPQTESLVLEVCLGSMSQRIPVQLSDEWSAPQSWSAKIYPGNMHHQSVTIHICSPVLSSVALYELLLHIETKQNRRSCTVGTFVLLCNPWLKSDPVYMPHEVQRQEYVKSDYGVVYMGTDLNVSKRPWSFGQYEPGVLEACLKLLHVSPQHLRDKHKDYLRRADPVYLSRVVCAMVNCNDDLGVVEGRWQGNYKGGVSPAEWSGTADILRRWASSNCKPVQYGQCWVFASVLCTVMRVLGIPARVVTVFNAAHDTDATLKIEECYSSTGEKLNWSKDSIWNFHVWVECWMRRPDLGAVFDGWQVVDPTPQEKSAGIFCCGPCPVFAIQQQIFHLPYDTPFLYASVDADIVRLIVRNGQFVGRKVDNESVGQLICTKRINSDEPEDVTQAYKGVWEPEIVRSYARTVGQPAAEVRMFQGEKLPGLEVSLNINGVPSLGVGIRMCVTVTNRSRIARVLMEHVNAQMKEYNRGPQECFWKTHRELHIQSFEVLTLHHTIAPCEYESFLAGDDIVNLAVVIKDMWTEERVLATREFSMSSQQITIEIEGGDTIQMNQEHTAHVSFTSKLTKTLNEAVLTVSGSGLLQGKHQTRLVHLKPGEKIEKKVSIMATSPGTKLLMATISHSNSPSSFAKSFHKVSVKPV
ncbi:protein-glutamine gamma-glutamyltransferase 5-like isoform X2 [Channa argus]|uniref:protein-glutamine gamma-glutamyltransferase 5-like isoform X2 n=1 Tax=Channa argus TaxID=215402 RepID=UPI0035221826